MFINRALIRLAKGSGREITITCIWNILYIVISTGISLCTAMIIRNVLGERGAYDFIGLRQLFAILFIFIIIHFIVLRVKGIQSAKCGIKIKEAVRKKLLCKLLDLGPAYMSDRQTGVVATTIFNKVEWLGNYYTIYMPTAISAIMNAVCIIILLAAMNGIIATVSIVAMAGVLGCPMLFYKTMSERGKKEWDAEEEYYSHCLEGIQGIVTLKSFGAEENQKKKIHMAGERLRKTVMGQLRVTMVENGILELMGRLGTAFCPARHGLLPERYSPLPGTARMMDSFL